MKIVPIGKNIFVKQDDKESRVSASGLIIPSSVDREQKAFGTVISVGSSIKHIKKGDRVIFGLYAGEEVRMNEKGKEVLYKLLYADIDEGDVLAFIND